ncbi:hypothetical protein ACLOJK_004315, partial [Asimina triloba]
YTAGALKFGAPSSPMNCCPTHRRRMSDRPIRSGQKDGSNISVLDPVVHSVNSRSARQQQAVNTN